MASESKQHDRNLLFAQLAVQLLGVPPARVMEAAGAWAVDPTRDLADRLVDANLITAAHRDLIWSLVERSVEAHLGDVVATLATFGGAEQIERTFTGSALFTRERIDFAIPPASPVKVRLDDVPGIPETPGRYSHVSEFARGGMGRVFLVHDVYLARDIALKELLPPRPEPGATAEPTPIGRAIEITARFLQEARITGQLEHPSIVPVYELGHRTDGTLYYTMKLVRGKTLSKVLSETADLESRLKLLPHFIDLCQALAYAHSRGVLHRDLKPSNVMIGEFGETVVIDWGLAKAKDQPDVHADPLASTLLQGRTDRNLDVTATEYGQVLGTPHYMPPEQAKGLIDSLDERSDVYSLGALLYQMLTGNPPFMGTTAYDVLNQVVSRTPVPVDEVVPDAPPELAAICSRALQKNQVDRYQSAKELAEEVQRYLSGAIVRAYRYRFSEHLRRFARQHKTALTISGAALVLLLALGVYYNIHLYRARSAERRQRLAAEEANRKLEWEYYTSALVETQTNLEKQNRWKAAQILQRLPERHRAWEWGRLMLESRPEVYAVPDDPRRGMTGMPLRAVFSPDGRHVLAIHDFGGVKTVFDIETGETIYISEVDRFLGWPWCDGFADDTRYLTLGVDDRSAVLFEYATNTVIARYTVESGWLCSLKLSHDGKLAAGYRIKPDKRSREIILWDAQQGTEQARFPLDPARRIPFNLDHWASKHEPPYGLVLGFLNDNHRLVYTDEQVVVLDTAAGERQTIAPCEDGRAALALEAEQVALLRPGGAVEIWSLFPSQRLRQMEAATSGLRNLEFSADGRSVGVAALQGWTLWDAVTGEMVRRYETDKGHVESLSFSPGGRCALTYGNESVLKFWDLSRDRTMRVLPPFTEELDYAEPHIASGPTWPNLPYEYDAAVTKLAHGYDSGEVKVWEVATWEVLGFWKAHDGEVTDVTFSSDGQTLYTAASDGTAKAWPTFGSEPLWTVAAGDREPVFSVACSTDSTRVAIGFGENTTVNNGVNHTRVVDAATGLTLFELEDPPQKTTLIAFTPDNRLILTGDWGRPGTDEASVQFYDATNGARLPFTVPGLGWPYKAVPVPGGNRILLLGTSREPVLWDPDTQQEVFRIQRYGVYQLAVHPDGRRFAGLSGSGIMIFAMSDGRPLLTIDNAVGPLSFTPDGRLLMLRRPPLGMIELPSEDWHPGAELLRKAEALQELQALVGL